MYYNSLYMANKNYTDEQHKENFKRSMSQKYVNNNIQTGKRKKEKIEKLF